MEGPNNLSPLSPGKENYLVSSSSSHAAQKGQKAKHIPESKHDEAAQSAFKSHKQVAQKASDEWATGRPNEAQLKEAGRGRLENYTEASRKAELERMFAEADKYNKNRKK